MLREMDRLPMGDVTFDAYITMNGQRTLDENRQHLDSMPLEGKAKEYALELFRNREIPVILVEEDRLYLNFENQRVIDVQTSISSKVPPVGTYDGAPLYQACVYVTREEESILEPIRDFCQVTRWHPGGVDLIAKGGGKRSAILRLLDKMGILPEETIAFGDGENDMGMLKLAGIGVAMGNAEEQVKKIADYVTSDIDEDGLEKALKHFQLV
jgi:Cof subfamily protein (haloacid dehalogenase superfamily)